MRNYFNYIIEIFESRFWPLPTLISTLVTIAFVPIFLLKDSINPEYLSELLEILPRSGGARAFFGTISASIISVTGVLFSITFVVLQQSATLYSPRVIENFMRSKFTQSLLGVFIGTFNFNILQLLSVDDGNAVKNILPILVGLLLAMICAQLLILYIFNIAKAIKSITILDQIVKEGIETLEAVSEEIVNTDEIENLNPLPRLIVDTFYHSKCYGYLQRIDWSKLSSVLALSPKCSCELLVCPGDYILQGQEIIKISNAKLSSSLNQKILDAFIIGKERTRSQDPRFSMQQVVDICSRALSPGVNDLNTAKEAINSLGVLILKVHELNLGDAAPRLKKFNQIKLKHPSYRQYLDQTFDPIINAAKKTPSVQEKINELLELCYSICSNSKMKTVIARKIHQNSPLKISKMHAIKPLTNA